MRSVMRYVYYSSSIPFYVSTAKVFGLWTCHFVDELTGFEEEWKGKGQKYLPGWTGSIGE